MRTSFGDAPITRTDQQGAMLPHQLFATADSLQISISLIALAEGHARFVTGSPAITHEPRRGLPGALDRLAEQCGYALTEELIRAVVVAGPPLAVHIVGDCGTTDQAALDLAEQCGIAHIVAPPILPPRHPARDRSWFEPIADAWKSGRLEALLVVIPPGALPLWVPPLLTTLSNIPCPAHARLLILGSDTDLSTALPPGALLIPRDDRLTERLTDALNRERAVRLLDRFPVEATIVSRPEALTAAARAIASARRVPCVLLDVADGTTVIVANNGTAAVYHHPDIDCARGAVRLLNRVKPDEIARWLPFTLDATALRTWALRRVSWPMAILTDDEDCAVAAALARAALRVVLGTITSPIPEGAVWIVGQSIMRLGPPAVALRMIADLMPSVRVATVAGDADDLLAVVGALGSRYPDDVIRPLTDDALLPVGSVIQAVLSGERAGEPLSATFTHGDHTMTVDLLPNAIATIAGDVATTVTLTRNGRDDAPIRTQGGPGGILVDTRRRPLTAIPQPGPRPNVSGRLRPALAIGDVSRRSSY